MAGWPDSLPVQALPHGLEELRIDYWHTVGWVEIAAVRTVAEVTDSEVGLVVGEDRKQLSADRHRKLLAVDRRQAVAMVKYHGLSVGCRTTVCVVDLCSAKQGERMAGCQVEQQIGRIGLQAAVCLVH